MNDDNRRSQRSATGDGAGESALGFTGARHRSVLGSVHLDFQAATQINEQTLTFVPKIVLTLATFALLFPWIMGHLVEFGTRLIMQAGSAGP